MKRKYHTIALEASPLCPAELFELHRLTDAWFLNVSLFNEQLSPREHAALLLAAPLAAQQTSLHYFLRGQFSLRLLLAMDRNQSMDAFIPLSYQKKLLNFIGFVRSKEQFFKEVLA